MAISSHYGMASDAVSRRFSVSGNPQSLGFERGLLPLKTVEVSGQLSNHEIGTWVKCTSVIRARLLGHRQPSNAESGPAGIG
jgi:hypothetical protein